MQRIILDQKSQSVACAGGAIVAMTGMAEILVP
jgi:hypothetical protein